MKDVKASKAKNEGKKPCYGKSILEAPRMAHEGEPLPEAHVGGPGGGREGKERAFI